ncbi:hypothetical protein A3Q56_04884 [Intoshia linei]|uniref:Uncharacterized protein n=1 Tax=Intoshia linei TaxID=1819745 RepID=A0A177AZE3_9BILA|nr:hypothetical protein A3Q56_04884 [Intoshia linei]
MILSFAFIMINTKPWMPNTVNLAKSYMLLNLSIMYLIDGQYSKAYMIDKSNTYMNKLNVKPACYKLFQIYRYSVYANRC